MAAFPSTGLQHNLQIAENHTRINSSNAYWHTPNEEFNENYPGETQKQHVSKGG